VGGVAKSTHHFVGSAAPGRSRAISPSDHRLTVGPESMAVPGRRWRQCGGSLGEIADELAYRPSPGARCRCHWFRRPATLCISTADPVSSPSGWKSSFFPPAPRQRYGSKRQLYESCRTARVMEMLGPHGCSLNLVAPQFVLFPQSRTTCSSKPDRKQTRVIAAKI
jgi:hypothetical protein